MENTDESVENASNSLIKINQIVNENLQKTWRLQAYIKYLKTECENLDKVIKDLKARIEEENQTCKNFEKSLERALKIKDLEIYTIDLATKTHPQLVQREIDEKNKLREWTDNFESTYDKHLKKFKQFKRDTEEKNPLLKELRDINKEINKLEFHKKFLNENIRDAKRTYELKKEIYQKIFYAIVVNFVKAVNKYQLRKSVLNELKENEVQMENQHNQYKRKYIETENKRVSESISNKVEINKLNLQLPGNLMGNTYQSFLPKIPLRNSYQNYDTPDTNMSRILTKYKKRSEERCEKTKKVDLFTRKQSSHTMFIKSTEIKPKEMQGAKRSFEDGQSMKPVKKSFKPQKIVTAEPNQSKPSGILKKNIENENTNEHNITLSQKSVAKQVVFSIKNDSSTKRALANDKIITSSKSQANSTQSQSDKSKLTPSTKISAVSTNFRFMLGSQEETQLPDNTKRVVSTQNKKELTFPTVMSSFGFGSGFQISPERITEANKKPEQRNITKNTEVTEKDAPFLKPPNSNAMEKQSREFSPYFTKSESLRQESQSDKSNINEEQEMAKNANNTATDLVEGDSEAEQYLSYEFLTPQEDELSTTQNITFLGEDQYVADSGEDRNGFVFNLGQPSSQSSFKPFSFFN